MLTGTGNVARFITLDDAIQRYGLRRGLLTQMVSNGIIKAGVFGEQLLLAEEDIRRVSAGKPVSVNTALTSAPEVKLISLADAAQKYDIPKGVLERLIEEHRIRIQNNGSRMLFEEDVQAVRHLSRARFRHLEGKKISINEASRQYKIPPGTIARWVMKKKIRTLKREGRYRYIDESDIAYAALLSRELGMRAGKGVLPEKVY